ncbi:hypothetical protein BJB45_12480 [Halomonas huangheensis]|uniref:Uncharacterized protein n=1 Tax=Halomonas huangheensis TaxID=1178482 RepID=W1N8S2_9GAMM|nr:hypothetical protein BJB45_12480 [Halomonas huangheensis]
MSVSHRTVEACWSIGSSMFFLRLALCQLLRGEPGQWLQFVGILFQAGI